MKYSIVIPAKNGMPYLKYAVSSVLSSNYADLELIVSLDETGDGSKEFLSGFQDHRLRIISPQEGLSMSEHWDFAQSNATGDWQMFLGQDDLLMSGYIKAFESLTEVASARKIDVVVARRAYVTWPPLGNANLKALQYWHSNELETRSSHRFVARSLLNNISYHAGPQMYTSTLISKGLVESIRKSNGGSLVMGHPQDAYLAASILKYFLGDSITITSVSENTCFALSNSFDMKYTVCPNEINFCSNFL
jgi:glycosyltransferase involved in cell wall biosynthesis